MTKPLEIPMDLRDRVYLITGGTGSLGSEVVFELAKRGARLILLCRNAMETETTRFIKMTKRRFANQHIYGVSCNLRSSDEVHKVLRAWSAPKFRRLDGIICCATDTHKRHFTEERIPRASAFVVNFVLQRFLLSTICETMLQQPSDRDIRVVIVTSSIQRAWPNKNWNMYWQIRHRTSFEDKGWFCWRDPEEPDSCTKLRDFKRDKKKYWKQFFQA